MTFSQRLFFERGCSVLLATLGFVMQLRARMLMVSLFLLHTCDGDLLFSFKISSFTNPGFKSIL